MLPPNLSRVLFLPLEGLPGRCRLLHRSTLSNRRPYSRQPHSPIGRYCFFFFPTDSTSGAPVVPTFPRGSQIPKIPPLGRNFAVMETLRW
ncbi:hypothetical protein JTE90_018937 [Oedothorax gibbosus]|uniref:Uncharacterized protein n=1 Tax=Oedothorax gibbosus TaxID=931172 RepID=A0AAV6VUD7_9ARAC|nr:hypothetical protein JTE90_018937 [Oedothorax gibbosus]